MAWGPPDPAKKIPPNMAGQVLYLDAMDETARENVALWRLGVLGPLCSAKLEHGDLKACFLAAAQRVYVDPEGHPVQMAARTVEEWYYTYRRHGFEGLKPHTRSDHGISRAIPVEVAELILRAKQEKPRRSINRIIKMLVRAHKVAQGELTRSSVHRLLARFQISGRPVRGPSQERRLFLSDHAGDLWMGDAMHGPLVVAPNGKLCKAYLLSQVDAATGVIHGPVRAQPRASLWGAL